MEAITNPNLTNNMGIKLDCLKLLYDISIGNYNVEAEFQTYLVKNQVIINQRLLELYLDINEDNSGNPYKSKDYLMKFLNFLNNHNYILEWNNLHIFGSSKSFNSKTSISIQFNPALYDEVWCDARGGAGFGPL